MKSDLDLLFQIVVCEELDQFVGFPRGEVNLVYLVFTEEFRPFLPGGRAFED